MIWGEVMDELIRKAAEIIVKSHSLIALTGAGISVESGIPDFRSAGGLWDKYDPSVYAHIDSFHRNPRMVWKMIFDMIDLTRNARPNSAHQALAELERRDFLKGLITQNIDNLHQEAGSRNVIEFHGNAKHLECLNCPGRYEIDEFELKSEPPQCRSCGEILKPSVIFFGEMIPQKALMESQVLSASADAILVIGTSAVVYPASSIPYTAKQHGARVMEFNLERTGLTGVISDIFIQGSVGITLPLLVEEIEKLQQG